MAKTLELSDTEQTVIKVCLNNYKKRVEFLKKNKLVFPHKMIGIDSNLVIIESLLTRLQ